MRVPSKKIFSGKEVVVDLAGIPLKQKNNFQALLEKQGAKITLVLSRNKVNQ